MGANQSTKLELAKEITLKAIDLMDFSFDEYLSAEEHNEKVATEIGKLFKSIHKAITEADKVY